jgi:exosortase
MSSPRPDRRLYPTALATALVMLALWSFWPVLVEMGRKWHSDPQYSHGYLVPVFSCVLLYLRRSQLPGASIRADWRGLLLLAFGALGYVAAGYVNFDYLAIASLLPVLAGIAVLVGGWPALRWSWPGIAFLIFMIPLPHRLEHALGGPLRSIATQLSTWSLQLLGFPAFGEGNVIVMEKGKIAVVEACSGLSMLLTFAALTTAMSIVIKRPLADKIVLLLSTIPVAIAVNALRIVSNGVAMDIWGLEVANDFFHDQAGWVMMPVAIAFLWLELWMMSHLLVPVAAEDLSSTIDGLSTTPSPAVVATSGPKPRAELNR